MEKALFFIDRVSTWTGKAFAWCILILTLGVSYEVFMRYVLRDPTAWAFDLSYMMYGALFMMGGAYALSRDSHVRGDVVFLLLKPRTQAIIEFTLYFLFFFPGVTALIYAGIPYAAESIRYKELSIYSPAGMPIYPTKILIPIAAAFLWLQGVAQTIRCIICMRTGAWPAHLHDVEEMETVILHQHESEMAKQQAGQVPGDAR